MEHLIHPRLLGRPVKVCVVGAGGTGSQVLTGLAQLHTALVSLGHPGGLDVTVVDDDTVSEANVGRQMFWPPDIGQPKATILVNRINMSMGTNWAASVTRVRQDQRIQADIVIGCVDNRLARKYILEGLQRGVQGQQLAYYLDIGNDVSSGQVVLGEVQGDMDRTVYPNRLPHVAELFPEIIDPDKDSPDDGPSCSLAAALEKQSLFINRGVSVFALNMLFELFRYGKLTYSAVFLNLKTGTSNALAIDPEKWARFGYKAPEAPQPTPQ